MTKFVLGKSAKAVLPVTIKWATGEGEEAACLVRVQFLAQSRREAMAELERSMKSLVRNPDESDAAYLDRVNTHSLEVAESAANRLRRTITGWDTDSGIVDEDGEPVPYSPDALSALLDSSHAIRALLQVYDHWLRTGCIEKN